MLPCVPAHFDLHGHANLANIGLRHCDLCLAFREFPEQSIPQKNRFVFRVSAIQHIDKPDIPAVPSTRFIAPGIFHPFGCGIPVKWTRFFLDTASLACVQMLSTPTRCTYIKQNLFCAHHHSCLTRFLPHKPCIPVPLCRRNLESLHRSFDSHAK